MNELQSAILLFIVFLYSTVCHEAAHAWVAYKLGDDTAFRGGQVSLDPIPHIKRAPIGMIVVPLIMLFTSGGLIGWGLMSVDREWARRNPVKDAWVSLAGPLANLALLLLAAIAIRIGLAQGIFEVPGKLMMTSFAAPAEGSGQRIHALAMTLGVIFSMNLLLFIFNLLPLPPLDGSNLPLFFLRGATANAYKDAIENPALAMVAILVAVNGFGPIFDVVAVFAFKLLYSGFI